jgi:hypothetical protein
LTMANDELWLSVSGLAKARGVSRGAVSRNLTRWKGWGEHVATVRKGRELWVYAPDYDRVHEWRDAKPMHRVPPGAPPKPVNDRNVASGVASGNATRATRNT